MHLLRCLISQSLAALFAIVVLSGCQTSPAAAKSTPTRLRVITFNIHHGVGADGTLDIAKIAQVITEHNADLVALQEVDRGVDRTQRRDLPAELASLTGMSCVFSNNFAHGGGEYGNAILSRHPVTGVTNYLLPLLTATEQRGLLQATIEMPTGSILFYSTHLDHRREEGDRLAGVQRILEVVRSSPPHPVIIAGDFNATPNSETYRRMNESFKDAWTLSGQGNGFTIPIDRPSRRIDYIWFNNAERLDPVQARVISTKASDHLPVLVEFEFK